MLRSILAVLAGAVLWSVCWLPFTAGMQAAFPKIVIPEQYLGHVPLLLGYLVMSFVFSIGAVYLTAPVWYHLAFLLLIPGNVLDGVVQAGRRPAQQLT